MERRGMKPADLARALDLPQSTVSRWCNGALPHKHTLRRIERAVRSPFEPASPPEPITDPPLASPVAPVSAGTLRDDHEVYLTADLPGDMRFDVELDSFTMSELIRMVRLLTVSTYDKSAILQKMFRRMEELEATAAK